MPLSDNFEYRFAYVNGSFWCPLVSMFYCYEDALSIAMRKGKKFYGSRLIGAMIEDNI